MSSSNPTAIIINTRSGRGIDLTTTIVQQAQKLGWSGQVHQTTGSATEVAQIVARLRQHKVKRVVVAAGDGTIRLVAQELLGTSTELAIIPIGTGNLLALNLRIPSDTQSAIKLAITGKSRPLMTGRVNQTIFLVAAGIGMDAQIMQDADTAAKNRYGLLAYIVAGAKYLLGPSHTFRLQGDVSGNYRAKTILISNLGKLHGGINLVPEATADQKQLQLVVVSSSHLLDWLSLLLWLLIGQPQRSRAYHHYRIQNCHIKAETPLPYQADGDVMGIDSSLHAHLSPQTLSIVYGD